MTRMTKRQAKVHAMILNVGGYWRPVNAVARLLEELAELGEQLIAAESSRDREHLADEFADLWIISTCIANQFNMIQADHLPVEHHTSLSEDGFASLVRDAGQIARIVNYYDGPKNPRSLDGFPTLTSAIAAFQSTLRQLAVHHGIDLYAAVDSKVADTEIRDRGRFAVSYDPSTADALEAFNEVRQSTHCIFSETARLWGAPTWDSLLSVEQNVELIIPFLTCFAKAAERECLDGFVVCLNDGCEVGNMDALSRHFARILTCLAARDPYPENAFAGEVLTPGWQFSFYGVRLFISVFSPLYPASHSRHCRRGTFVMLQPETSFDAHRVGSKFAGSEELKRRIRENFIRAGISYSNDYIEAKIEARIYLLPRWQGDTEVAWWEYV
jgi:hypothetical protein